MKELVLFHFFHVSWYVEASWVCTATRFKFLMCNNALPCSSG